MEYGQMSRYGAIARSLPVTTGKVYFLVDASEQAVADFGNRFPADEEGFPRVFTTWATVLTAIANDTNSAAVIVSPLFTTAPTLAQRATLDSAKVVTIQAGQNLPDGSYLAERAVAAIATATTMDLFQVNGRIRLIDILGEVVTTLGATTTKFLVAPDVGSSTDISAAISANGLAVGGSLKITGVLADATVVTTQGAMLAQANQLYIKAGKIQLNTTNTSTGNLRFKVRYVPLDPGAFVSPL